jgi:hypothetical protein
MTRTLVQMIESPVDAPLDREELCRLYRDSDETVASLMARSGLRPPEFYQLLRDQGLALRRPRRNGRVAHDPEMPRKPVRREDLIARLWEAASGHMAQIETRLARLDRGQASDTPPAGTESELRLMGLIVKTLRDLAALDADVAGARKKEMVQDDLAAELATCPESMRAELARRLAGLREGR